jgi:pimeloyl-ACP methyl ester carboxylesterase
LSLPGAEYQVALGCNRWARDAGATVVRSLHRFGVRPGPQFGDVWDRRYLAGDVPTLIVCGANDHILPAHQAHATHAAIPGSRLEIFEGVGHYPNCEDPERFSRLSRTS